MQQDVFIDERLKTPHSAAIAGILFAVLLAASIVLIRLAFVSNPAEAGKWLVEGGRRTAAIVGMNLVPFAGIAFLWFMGVIRGQLGEREDRLLATVFLGSGLLFVALLFVCTAVAMAMFDTFHSAPASAMETWTLGRQIALALLNVFAIRMAAVFMISTSTIAIRTSFFHRPLAFLGVAIALVLLFISGHVPYINLLLPAWVFLVSVEMIIRNLRRGRGQSDNVVKS